MAKDFEPWGTRSYTIKLHLRREAKQMYRRDGSYASLIVGHLVVEELSRV